MTGGRTGVDDLAGPGPAHVAHAVGWDLIDATNAGNWTALMRLIFPELSKSEVRNKSSAFRTWFAGMGQRHLVDELSPCPDETAAERILLFVEEHLNEQRRAELDGAWKARDRHVVVGRSDRLSATNRRTSAEARRFGDRDAGLNKTDAELAQSLIRHSARPVWPPPRASEIDQAHDLALASALSGGGIPPYVRRSADEAIDEAFAAALATYGVIDGELPESRGQRTSDPERKMRWQERVIVVVGPSRSGKTRSVFEAIARHGLGFSRVLQVRAPATGRSTGGETQLVAPARRPLSDLASRSWRPATGLELDRRPVVVIVDELERHLAAGESWPVSAQRLADHQPGCVVVIAMLGIGDRGDHEVPGRELVGQTILLDAGWDPVEQELARSLYYEQLLDGRLQPHHLRRLPVHLASSASGKQGGHYLLQSPPPVPETVVGRSTELDELDEWWQAAGGMAIVHGPAGYGKSTLIAAWLDERRSDAHAVQTYYWSFDRNRSYARFRAELENSLGLEVIDSSAEDPAARVVGALPADSLVVLDGLEKALTAYEESGAVSGDAVSLRRSREPELERLLLMLRDRPRGIRLLIGSRVVPEVVELDPTGPRPIVLRLRALDPGSAVRLLRSLLAEDQEALAAPIAELTQSPYALRFIAGLLRTGHLSSEEISPASIAPVDGATVADAQLFSKLLDRLPQDHRDLLASAVALGGLVRRVERDALEYVRTSAKNQDIGRSEEAIILHALPSMSVGLFDYDAGGVQENPNAGSTLRPDRVRAGELPGGSPGSRHPVEVLTALRQLAVLGLAHEVDDEFAIVPAVQDAMASMEPNVGELTALAAFYARLTPLVVSAEDLVVITAQVVKLLTLAGRTDLAIDLFFEKLAHPLFFGTADYVLLRTLAEGLIQASEMTPVQPRKAAHLLAFEARLLTKNRRSVAALSLWRRHIELRKTDRVNVAAGLGLMAWDVAAMGDFYTALALEERARHEMAHVGDDDSTPSWLVQSGMLWSFSANAHRALGEYDEAEAAITEAERVWRHLDGHRVGTTNSLLDQSRLKLARGDVEGACGLADDALGVATAASYVRGIVVAEAFAGLARVETDPEDSVALINLALARCRGHRYPELEPELLAWLARAELANGNVGLAAVHANEALAMATSARLRPVAADAATTLAEARLADGSTSGQLFADAMLAAFGPSWKEEWTRDGWSSNWRRACRADVADDPDPGRYAVWDWHSGAWDTMKRLARLHAEPSNEYLESSSRSERP